MIQPRYNDPRGSFSDHLCMCNDFNDDNDVDFAEFSSCQIARTSPKSPHDRLGQTLIPDFC